MALLFCDGCDSYSVNADLLKKWGLNTSNAWSLNSSGGRTGGGCLQGAASNTSQLPLFTQAGIASTTLIGVGFWFKASTYINSSGCKLIDLRDTNNVSVGGIGCTTYGGVEFLNTSNGLVGGAIGCRNICDNQWHWIEARLQLGANLAVTQTCWVDGLQQIITTNTIQTAGSIDRFGLGNNNLNAGVPVLFDDIIFFDDSGSGLKVSNMPIGSRLITTTRPNSDSATIQWNPSSGGTHYTLVNEQTPDGDTSYVEDNVSGHIDLYGMGALGITSPTIEGVMLNTYAKNPNAGSQLFQHVCKSSSTTSTSSSLTAPAAYITQQSAFPVDPATSAAWAGSALDLANFGVKIP